MIAFTTNTYNSLPTYMVIKQTLIFWIKLIKCDIEILNTNNFNIIYHYECGHYGSQKKKLFTSEERFWEFLSFI